MVQPAIANDVELIVDRHDGFRFDPPISF